MYDIKKIMRGVYINETQVPAIRIEVVMDCIPEKMQSEVENALRTFEETAKGIVRAATNTTPVEETTRRKTDGTEALS